MVVPLASGVPAPAPHELRRERLLELLHHHRTRPLILLVAPAGFGKSTLAGTYARDSGAAVAWLTLQPSDRDSQRFFARLLDTFEIDNPTAIRATAHGGHTELRNQIGIYLHDDFAFYRGLVADLVAWSAASCSVTNWSNGRSRLIASTTQSR